MDADLFYHGSETERRLVAVAHRAAESILRSSKFLTAALVAELWALLSPDTLWGLCLVLAGWFLSTVISGPIGMAINVALLAYGLWDLWGRIQELYALLKEWFWGFYQATTEEELDRAGQHFAQALTRGGFTMVELVLTHRAFKYASSKLVERFPPPEQLKQRVREERTRSAERKESEGNRGTEEKSQRDGETGNRPIEEESAKRRRAEVKVAQRLRELRGTLALSGAVAIGRDVGQKLPDSAGNAVLVGLLAVTTAGLVALAIAASGDDKKERSR